MTNEEISSWIEKKLHTGPITVIGKDGETFMVHQREADGIYPVEFTSDGKVQVFNAPEFPSYKNSKFVILTDEYELHHGDDVLHIPYDMPFKKTSSPTVYTIGHSNLDKDEFIDALETVAPGYLIDVRTMPASRYTPHFNRKALEETAEERGYDYVFLGDELGGRPSDSKMYDPKDGHARYDIMSKSSKFHEGMEKIVDLVRDRQQVVLLCSEKDPLECHRTLMVSELLDQKGIPVSHIIPKKGADSYKLLSDDELIFPHAEIISRLPNYNNVSRSKLIADQTAKVAYKSEKSTPAKPTKTAKKSKVSDSQMKLFRTLDSPKPEMPSVAFGSSNKGTSKPPWFNPPRIR